jgi:hypothetical protein
MAWVMFNPVQTNRPRPRPESRRHRLADSVKTLATCTAVSDKAKRGPVSSNEYELTQYVRQWRSRNGNLSDFARIDTAKYYRCPD